MLAKVVVVVDDDDDIIVGVVVLLQKHPHLPPASWERAVEAVVRYPPDMIPSVSMIGGRGAPAGITSDVIFSSHRSAVPLAVRD